MLYGSDGATEVDSRWDVGKGYSGIGDGNYCICGAVAYVGNSDEVGNWAVYEIK